ncbi:MAG: hypothetical protein ABJF04_18700 [Reichenbachiella sp.]|uniref:hypothetical protein n=1 Tax=Reichenbachiella sp. TaxID=2184521 RepID=UPI003264962D
MRIVLFVFVYFFCARLTLAQSSNYQFNIVLLEKNSSKKIPYAHILQGKQLVTVSDHFGNAQINNENLEVDYTISCIGFGSLQIRLSKLNPNQRNIVFMTPDRKILEAIIITPTSLTDMIAEVYSNIPNAYQSKPHMLSGVLEERYMDTLGHANISSSAELQIQKAAYLNRNTKGEVKIDSLARQYDVKENQQYQIYAGAHIPHRFDFVMRREEFINPNSFDKYMYTYKGEREVDNRKLEVIQFEPKSKGLLGAHFRGKIYLDMNEKVFVKAKYEYTKFGILSNTASRWADQRVFITEYKSGSEGWYFAYTWDEAVNYERNFLLSQYYRTSEVTPDTISDWNYEERTHFVEAIEAKTADTVVIISKPNALPDGSYARKRRFLEFIKKIEAGFGLELYKLNAQNIDANADLIYNFEAISLNESFRIPSFDIGLSSTFRYRIRPNYILLLNQSENYNQSIKKSRWSLGMAYRLNFETLRPTHLSFSMSYAEFKNQFMFDKQLGLTPIYQQKASGLMGGLNYEIRVNPKWKIGLSYNYFYSFNDKERLYVKKKYGLFNLFSKKHDYPQESIVWRSDEGLTTPDVFDRHSFALTLMLSLE